MIRHALFLLMVVGLVCPAFGDAMIGQVAGPARIVHGAFGVQFAPGVAPRRNDVFTIRHGTKVLGNALVIMQVGAYFILVPLQGFHGTPVKADVASWSGHQEPIRGEVHGPGPAATAAPKVPPPAAPPIHT